MTPQKAGEGGVCRRSEKRTTPALCKLELFRGFTAHNLTQIPVCSQVVNMPGAGFRICSIAWRDVFDFFLDDNPFDGNDDEDDEESDEEDDGININDLDVRDTMRASVKSAVISEEEEKNIGIGPFLQQRFEVALRVYDKRSGGMLIKALRGDSSKDSEVDDEVLMDTIREKRPEWYTFVQYIPKVCWVTIDLEKFGEFRCEIETMRMVEVESSLSLSHIVCVNIGAILSHEHRVNRYKPWIRLADWSTLTKWKVAKLDMPEEASKRLVTTMCWMFWSDLLEEPCIF